MNRAPQGDGGGSGGRPQRPRRLDAEYVVPLKWSPDEDEAEFGEYLRVLADLVDVTVVDGSERSTFDRHHAAWHTFARHVRPAPWPGRNGKVAGVVTGVRCARHDTVVLADDDVRYTGDQLREAVARFTASTAAVLRPQNYFAPLPWHARWDTARSLLNRAVGTDYPGTFVLSRSTFLQMGGYDGDVLFENLQMLRSFAAAGGREQRAPDLYVARRPPTAARFLDQRVRQAYDDFAQPARLTLELSALPLLTVIAARRPAALPLVAGSVIAAAEAGRRRHGGVRVFPRSSALWAPLWLLERAVCVWLAALERVRGGVRYRGERLPAAASPPVRRAPLTPLGSVDGNPPTVPDDGATTGGTQAAARRPMENAR